MKATPTKTNRSQSRWKGVMRKALCAAALTILAASGGVEAQAQTVRGRPCEGQYFFVIRDPRTGEIVASGWTNPDGTIPDGVVLGPNRPYTIEVLDGVNNRSGLQDFTTGPNGSTTMVRPVQMGDDISGDPDGDGVSTTVERGMGLDPNNPSTIGGGISDKVIATTPPPPGTPPGGPMTPGTPPFGPPGIINSVSLTGTCVDVSALNDILGLARLANGVDVFNIFGGNTPRLIATVDTPGEARAVSVGLNAIAVADGPRGLGIIDISDPTTAFLRTSVSLGSYAQGVAAFGGSAVVALRNGSLVLADLSTGAELHRLNLPAEVYDVFAAGDHVWAIVGNTLRSFSSQGAILTPVGSVNLANVGPDPLSFRKRLLVGGGRAFATSQFGWDDVDVRNPAGMIVVGRPPATGAGSFKHIVSTGSGRGLAAVGTNPRADGTHDVYLYNLSNPAVTTDLVRIFQTPGTAYANIIYNGLDYVADGERGLQVVRFLDIDRLGIAPTVSLSSSAVEISPTERRAEEGKPLRVTANAADDLLVRNVEFHVDGALLASDGNFPFEVTFTTPLISPVKTRVTVRARAFDTGGNSTWSNPFEVSLAPDGTPPLIVATQPRADAIAGAASVVLVLFNEPLRQSAVTPGALTVVGAGADRIFGTPDDTPLTGDVSYQEAAQSITFRPPAPLGPGLWRARVAPTVTDRAGNPLRDPLVFTFTLFGQDDRDGDGVPDLLEASLGLDPDNPDSKRDGVRDGDRDFDNDFLSNAYETLWGLDPTNPRSRNPQVLDGNLDMDGDGLSNRMEQAARTNPNVPDSDGDGWNDEAEFTTGSNPLDPLSRPRLFVSSGPPTKLGLSQFTLSESGGGLFAARPPVKIGLPAIDPEALAQGVTVSRPPVKIGLGATGLEMNGGLFVARPPVKVSVTGALENDLGVTVAQPPVKIGFEGQ